MTARERFLRVLRFQQPDDRQPMIEWAAWWDQTINRWQQEGMPADITWDQSLEYFGLDKLVCIVARGQSSDTPKPPSHGAPIIHDAESYKAIKSYLYTDSIIDNLKQAAEELKPRHDRGEVIIRLWLDGFFWFPRTLLGIQNHLYAFYDQPELMHQINRDLTEFTIRVVKELFPLLTPDMVGFAEDMSYNHGPMVSYELFRTFITPYYQEVIPHIKEHGVKILIDSDGDISSMVPWMLEAGLEGVYPLERQAGVDIAQIRQEYPEFLMMGGFDKMVMSQGEGAMRGEFERLLPVMRSGGYILSVDHQTPPGVSLTNYQTYISLLREYCKKAVQ